MHTQSRSPSEQDDPILAFPPVLLVGPVFGTLVLGGLLCTTTYSTISYCIQSWLQVSKIPITPEDLAISTGWLILQCALLAFFLNRISVGARNQLQQAVNADHVNKYYANFFPLTGIAGLLVLFAFRDLTPGIFIDGPPLYLSAIAGASVVCMWYIMELAFYNGRAEKRRGKGDNDKGGATYDTDSRWWQRFGSDLVYGAAAGMLAGGVAPLISTAIESWLGVTFYPLASAVAQISISYGLAQSLHPIYLRFRKNLEESLQDFGCEECHVL